MGVHYNIVAGKLIARDFESRLTGFSPDLASFLQRVWQARMNIDVKTFRGADQIYQMYNNEVGNPPQYTLDELFSFIYQLRGMHDPGNISVQDYPRRGAFTALSDFSDSLIEMKAAFLAKTFFHCMNAYRNAFSRIYVHAPNLPLGMAVLKQVVGQFAAIPGINEAKIVGPAMAHRSDTIVIYFEDAKAEQELLPILVSLQKQYPHAFAPGVTSLVNEVAPGIGVAHEPPRFEIVPHQGSTHSFGSFYCDLIFLALRHTPNVHTPQADGRHMLDFMGWTCSVLGINPRNHAEFPSRGKLEAFQQALAEKAAAARVPAVRRG